MTPEQIAQSPLITERNIFTYMTLDQMKMLSPEQMRAVVQTIQKPAEAELDKVSNQLRAQVFGEIIHGQGSTDLWPNYTLTAYIAIAIPYTTYLSDYLNKFNGPDWSDDGCSGPTAPSSFDSTACKHHDFGYRNVALYQRSRLYQEYPDPWTLDDYYMRRLIDQRFSRNMADYCNSGQPYSGGVCTADADIFWIGVRIGGESAFDEKPIKFR